jgi:hypothetical protein
MMENQWEKKIHPAFSGLELWKRKNNTDLSGLNSIEKAREIARELVSFHKEAGLFNTIATKDTLKSVAVNMPNVLKVFAKTAEEDPVVYDIVKEICADLIEKGEQIPDELIPVVVRILRGRRRPRPKGPDPRANRSRDFYIAHIVHEVALRSGLKATRNDESISGLSACDIVQEVLYEEGMNPPSFHGIKKIYKRYSFKS